MFLTGHNLKYEHPAEDREYQYCCFNYFCSVPEDAAGPDSLFSFPVWLALLDSFMCYQFIIITVNCFQICHSFLNFGRKNIPPIFNLGGLHFMHVQVVPLKNFRLRNFLVNEILIAADRILYADSPYICH